MSHLATLLKRELYYCSDMCNLSEFPSITGTRNLSTLEAELLCINMLFFFLTVSIYYMLLLQHSSRLTFLSFRFEYTHIIFVFFPGRTDKRYINQILPKTECYSRKLQVFPSWDIFLHTFLQKLCQLYLISGDVMSTDDCTDCSETFVLQCGVPFRCGMTRLLCSTGLHHNTLKFNPFMFWK